MNHPSVFRATRLLLAIAVSGIAFFGPMPSARADARVMIVERDPNNASTWGFDPQDVTVPAGQSVTWEWKGQDKHSATSDTGVFDSGVKQGAGQTWSFKFDKPGEYPYSCTPHPYMYGTVRVT